MKKRWIIKNEKLHIASETVDELLRQRGVKDVERFLNPGADALIGWKKLSNIGSAIRLLERHLRDNNLIGIIVDSDFDGIMSATILIRYLRKFNANVRIIHHAKPKAHGLCDIDLDSLMDCKLIILPDGLSCDYDEYEILSNNDIDVLLLDHHPQFQPTDYAITVNCTLNGYPNKSLSGGAVTWKFCKAYDETHEFNYADELIDLAACSIIGDVMNVGEEALENRYICKLGFDNLTSAALKAIVGNYPFNSTSVMYSVSNLANACVRLGRCDLMMDLFLTDNKKEIKQIISEAKSLKAEQDAMVEKAMTDIVANQLRDIDLNRHKVIIATINEGGIAGLVANKLASLYNRSAIVVLNETIEEAGQAWLMGSCRAFGETDIRDKVNETQMAIAEGHNFASGFRIQPGNMNEFTEKLNSIISSKETGELKTDVDIALSIEDITPEFVRRLEAANQICGNGYDKITVALLDVKAKSKLLLGQKHSCINCSNIQLLKWNDTEFIQKIETADSFDCIAELELSKYSVPFKGIVRDYKLNISLPFAL